MTVSKLKNGIKQYHKELMRNIKDQPLGMSHYKKMGGVGYEQKDKKELEFGGVYSFWWATNLERFYELLGSNNQISLFGKQEKGEAVEVKIEFNEEWISRATHEQAILLYVGRSTNIANRITGHVKPQTRFLEKTTESNRKPNTVSQLRYGLERLFQIDDVRDLIMEHVHISTVRLSCYNRAVERFYLEQYAIGSLFPLLNIDVER
jgi:hypothetical protein